MSYRPYDCRLPVVAVGLASSPGENVKPRSLAVLLAPEGYGLGPERVQRFMECAFDLLLTATDEAIGYPDDDNRLGQRWCWCSLAARSDYNSTGNLFNLES